MNGNFQNNSFKICIFIAQWESALVVRGQIFEHSINYFTILKITKMLISQPNPNGFVFCKKHQNASVLPPLLSTHLTSSFNIWKVQNWPANSHCALGLIVESAKELLFIHTFIFDCLGITQVLRYPFQALSRPPTPSIMWLS